MQRIEEILTGKCLGRYRKELMGIAMIWVMLFHSYTGIVKRLNIPILYDILKHGNLGVEIFLFLSGFGLYHSLSRNDNILSFYKRRAIRVIIPWLIISCPYWIVKSLLVDRDAVSVFLMNWLGISFWTEGITTVWYIAFIVLLYAFYPLVFSVQRNNRYAIPLLIGSSILINALLLVIYPECYDNIEVALSRIPVFLLGSYVGESVRQSNSIIRNKKVYFYLFALLLLYAYPAIYNMFGLPLLSQPVFIFLKRLRGLIPALCVIIVSCWILMSFSLNTVKNVLSFIGTLTLEEYMLHVFLGNILHKSGISAKLNLPLLFLAMTLILFVSVAISYVFSNVFNKVISYFEERN